MCDFQLHTSTWTCVFPRQSEQEERQSADCPAFCTCHQTERRLVPLVRYHETGDRDHDSEHHWQYYHHHQARLNITRE